LRSVLESGASASAAASYESLINFLEVFRRHASSSIWSDSGLSAFREMYSRLLGQRVYPSHAGIEIVSFLAPRLTVHFLTIWPVTRFRIRGTPVSQIQYGIDTRAPDHIREFLLHQSKQDDVIVLLIHVPPENTDSWSEHEPDFKDWLGAGSAISMSTLCDYVLYPRSGDFTQPNIHLILSGHLQRGPLLQKFQSAWSYTAGAFHIASEISEGSFACRLTIDEGAIRIDTLKSPRGTLSRVNERAVEPPTIIAVSHAVLDLEDLHRYVLQTYDAEADTFIQATDIPGKYKDLEITRERFGKMLLERFEAKNIHILDIGAGAGRDSSFFLKQGFQVTAVEGAPRLAKALKARETAAGQLDVHDINFLDVASLRTALAENVFQGIWMCAALLHVPAEDDLVLGSSAPMLIDTNLIGLLAGHLAKGGLFYIDNKMGFGSHLRERGNILQRRWFRYRQPEELVRLMKAAKLIPAASGWYNGTNGFDAWTWITGENVTL
jgi:SAM-dependent methyltransferase